MITFLIQPTDDTPIYRQIIRQALDALASGRLTPGDRMPSQRELAQQLVVSPLTVKKAYDELERAGALETRRGQGTFVSADPGPDANSDLDARTERLRPLVRRLLGEAWAGRIPVDALVQLLRAEAALLDTERAAQRTTRKTRNVAPTENPQP